MKKIFFILFLTSSFLISSEQADVKKTGWKLGILAVPMKYRTSDRSTDAGATIGPALAYQLENDLTIAASFGTSTGTLDEDDNTKKEPEENTFDVFTYAVGVMYPIKDSDFQAGVVLGLDDGDDNWKYDQETWFAISVSYNFLRF